MIDAAPEMSFEPEIVVLCCQQCIANAGNLSAYLKKAAGFQVRFKVMPCSSKVEILHVIKILEGGTDGVEVVGCPEGRCRFLRGSDRCERRIDYARRLLDEIHMGADRVGMHRGQGLSEEQLVNLAGRRAEAIRPMGPNPMKSKGGR
jgi:coenzyme F420-reducing hydrogenase delta subunit